MPLLSLIRAKSVVLALSVVILSIPALAQSSDPAFPTPVTSSVLSGSIRARDIGDSRLTTYYYVFDGGQGDIFVNIVSNNLSGDIDIFTEAGLRPLAKIVIYADAGTSETGRLIYLRRPERLILRVQGRTPGDEAATFQIKFAGAFVAMAGGKDEGAPTVERSEDTGITVNSVGTIVATKPKPRPTPKSTAAEASDDKTSAARSTDPVSGAKQTLTEARKKPIVVVENIEGVSEESAARKKSPKPVTKWPPRQKPATAAVKPRPKPPVKEETVDPLASVRLVVTMKDGSVVEKRLTELVRFTFDKGILTLIGKDGTIVRYPMIDVAQVNVQ